MTQELADKLISHYEDVVRQVEVMGSIETIYDLLYSTNTSRGVCMCASEVFNEDVYADLWINSFGESFWFRYPSRYDTKPEILEALQFRIDRLKTFNQQKP